MTGGIYESDASDLMRYCRESGITSLPTTQDVAPSVWGGNNTASNPQNKNLPEWMRYTQSTSSAEVYKQKALQSAAEVLKKRGGKVTKDEFAAIAGKNLEDIKEKRKLADAIDFSYNEDGSVKKGEGDGYIDERDMAAYLATLDNADGQADGNISNAATAQAQTAAQDKKGFSLLRTAIENTHKIFQFGQKNVPNPASIQDDEKKEQNNKIIDAYKATKKLPEGVSMSLLKAIAKEAGREEEIDPAAPSPTKTDISVPNETTTTVSGDTGINDGKIADKSVRFGKNVVDNEKKQLDRKDLNYEVKYLPGDKVDKNSIDKKALMAASQEELGGNSMPVEDYDKIIESSAGKGYTVKGFDVNGDGKIDLSENATMNLIKDMADKHDPKQVIEDGSVKLNADDIDGKITPNGESNFYTFLHENQKDTIKAIHDGFKLDEVEAAYLKTPTAETKPTTTKTVADTKLNYDPKDPSDEANKLRARIHEVYNDPDAYKTSWFKPTDYLYKAPQDFVKMSKYNYDSLNDEAKNVYSRSMTKSIQYFDNWCGYNNSLDPEYRKAYREACSANLKLNPGEEAQKAYDKMEKFEKMAKIKEIQLRLNYDKTLNGGVKETEQRLQLTVELEKLQKEVNVTNE